MNNRFHMRIKWYIWVPILLGAAIRLFFFLISYKSQTYFGGDAQGYISMAENLARSWSINPADCFWTPGFSLYMAPFLRIFNDPGALALFNIFLNIFFTLWFSKKIAETGGRAGQVLCVWFLSLDPIWLTQTITIGADYLGAIIFGVMFVNFTNRPISELSMSRALFWGGLCAFAAFVKPVYLYIPVFLFLLQIPKQKVAQIKLQFIALFLAFWLIPISLYVNQRGVKSGTYNFSGHSMGLFGKYIVGHIFVGLGKTLDGPTGEEMASQEHNTLVQNDPSMTWGKHAAQYVKAYPDIFIKLFSASAFRTLFGNANVVISRFFNGQDNQGPGMWKTLAQGKSLTEKFSSISWGYIFGALITIIEKLVLVFFSIKGLLILKAESKYIEGSVLFLIVCYFIFSPVVFGEPRYFLPATLILLYLTALNWRRNPNRCAE